MTKDFEFIFGDTLSELARIPDKSIDMVLTDLPYGKTRQKWDSLIALLDHIYLSRNARYKVKFSFLEEYLDTCYADGKLNRKTALRIFEERAKKGIWSHLDRICKTNTAKVFHAAPPFTGVMMNSNLAQYKYNYIWIKNKGSNHLNVKRMPMRYYEDICVFYDSQPVFNQILSEGNNVRSGFVRRSPESELYETQEGHTQTYQYTEFRKPKDVLEYEWDEVPDGKILEYNIVNNDSPERYHANQKPVELLEYLISTYTHEGHRILDMTMGSGSTALAAYNTRRLFTGIDNGYCTRPKSDFNGWSWVDIAQYRLQKEIERA